MRNLGENFLLDYLFTYDYPSFVIFLPIQAFKPQSKSREGSPNGTARTKEGVGKARVDHLGAGQAGGAGSDALQVESGHPDGATIYF